MLKLLILTIQANCMNAIMQTQDLNSGFLCNCIDCLKNFVGINTVHTKIMNTFYMVCFCGYKHNFMLVL
jgi:hypothetical protein